ncbi:MAG: type II CRISPR RNA-guided endonuclease Cas9 [Parvularcula sp.]|jgi:CRISPR-associated endonuclease Csn1|nr:type II CRISPR RNA-guided endonuclease Cas9 [Parvularcula sp.]
MLILGLDIGTTSIGYAYIDHDPASNRGRILRAGTRIFPETRDKDSAPLNQTRRLKRMARRQVRRRKERRQLLNKLLASRGLLPNFYSRDWVAAMAIDPYELRRRGLQERLDPHEIGRALYHLAKHRHFRGRELVEATDIAENDADEVAAQDERKTTLQELRKTHSTLGEWLAQRDPHQQRRRCVHAHRAVVREEFERLWAVQAEHEPLLRDDAYRAQIEHSIFFQRPVFWRKSTLGTCRFMPGEPLCPKGAWLSHQRRMFEKLNNLAFIGGNDRPLDQEERMAILEKLQTQAGMTWGGTRAALTRLFKSRGEPGAERRLRFNLEMGGERGLLGNPLEAKLQAIFGKDWAIHPHAQAIRDAVHDRLWSADYVEFGSQRVVILSQAEREKNRAEVARSFIRDYGISSEEAQKISQLSLSTGWEPFSTKAMQAFLPHLEAGVRFGSLLTSPEWEKWRNATFPGRERPTGEGLQRLPSPATRTERGRLAKIRNPTVVRCQNELRKVVNNLIQMVGKPELVRIEVAREVGLSKKQREETIIRIRKNEKRRREAAIDLEANGIAEPSRDIVEKWLLWKESGERCPYTGNHISFDALFRQGLYEVEHIWPRSRSFDDSFGNKALCCRDFNLKKGNRTPYEFLGDHAEAWSAFRTRLDGMMAKKGGVGMSPSKVRRFLAKEMPDDFANRQLNDTGYAAREAVASLKRLWPDLGPTAPVKVQAVTGRVTAQLRALWGLNNILAEDGKKTRADHRHHAIDALVVACVDPGLTNMLSRYWQAKDDPRAVAPALPPPWPTIRTDAQAAVADIIVSHRVRKKVSGALHKETTYGDTKNDVRPESVTYREFVTRKNVAALTRGDLASVRDKRIRELLQESVERRGGDPKKAFPPYPRLGHDGPEIRKVRLLHIQQLRLMAPVATGYADLGANHHIAIYRNPDGSVDFEVVSLFEAARRLTQREPIVRRQQKNGAKFVMSLAPGETIEAPEGKTQGVWVVQGVWANGQVVLLKAADAIGDTIRRPGAASLLREGARKISVDPIGRVRRAND